MSKRLLPFAAFAILLALAGCHTVLLSKLGPPGEGKSPWIGSWESEEHPHVRGQLVAHLPEPIAKTIDFEVPVIVTYDLFTLYRAGAIVETTLTGRLDARSTMAGDNTDNPINVPERLVLVAELPCSSIATSGPYEQTLRFEATLDTTSTVFTGTYLSSSPYDRGSFTLTKR